MSMSVHSIVLNGIQPFILWILTTLSTFGIGWHYIQYKIHIFTISAIGIGSSLEKASWIIRVALLDHLKSHRWQRKYIWCTVSGHKTASKNCFTMSTY